MKIERTKNASRNMAYGLLLKAYHLLLPFLLRTVMIYTMGAEYLGLGSLFTSLLQVLNLAELGVGMAMVYTMYQPIAEDDTDQICALMNLYKRYYRRIGCVIGAAGLALMPLLPHLVKSDLPADVNLYVLYALHLGAAVGSYWLFAYKNCLLEAHQRVDITSKISLITSSILYLAQLLILIFLKNYYAFTVSILITQGMNQFLTARTVDRMYPQYRPRGELPPEKIRAIHQRVRDLFTAKLGGVVVNAADAVVISAFLGLRALAVYQNYFFIVTAVIGTVAIIFSSCTAGIGNSLIVETKEKNFRDLRTFTFLIVWIATFCGTCFLCLFQPFMKLWVGEALMLGMPAVVCFCLYFFVYEIHALLNLYKDAAGIWHADRFRPLATALTNLALNLLTVRFLGIYGVLLSTVVSTLLVGMPWLLRNLFTCLFDPRHMRGYALSLIRFFAAAAGTAGCTYFLCAGVSAAGGLGIVIRLAICLTVPQGILFLLFRRRREFADAAALADRMTHGKLNLKKLFGGK